MEGYLEKLRRAELETIKAYVPPGTRVLEIGGGSGYQASVLASWRCSVTSLDVADRPPLLVQFHPVTTYDGRHIPFPAASFDVVFSSNVLEHVAALAALCAEMRRVLVPHGLAIHMLPTATWRLWTSVAHYPYLATRLMARLRKRSTPRALPTDAALKPVAAAVPPLRWSAGAHGEYPSEVSELYYFSRRRWLSVLSACGFDPVYVGGNGYFYTGYTLLPSLSIRIRRAAARILGSSCHVFVMRAR